MVLIVNTLTENSIIAQTLRTKENAVAIAFAMTFVSNAGCKMLVSNVGCNLASMTWNPVLSTAHGYSYCFADANDNIAECIGNEGTDWDSGFPSGFKIRSA